jgi:hypothetical protein
MMLEKKVDLQAHLTQIGGLMVFDILNGDVLREGQVQWPGGCGPCSRGELIDRKRGKAALTSAAATTPLASPQIQSADLGGAAAATHHEPDPFFSHETIIPAHSIYLDNVTFQSKA